MKPQLHGESRFWHDEDGRLHRSGGPAIEYSDGSKTWKVRGLPHRKGDCPFVEQAGASFPSWFTKENS